MELQNNKLVKGPKRILIFSLTYLPFIGGAEVALKEITDRLDPTEYEFELITLQFNSKLARTEKIGNITIHRVGFGVPQPTMADMVRFPLQLNKYLFLFLAWSKASRLHSQKKFDAIWSMMANYAGFGALFFKSYHPEVPFLLSLQEGDPIEHIKKRVRFVYPIFKKIFEKADRIQTISKYLADFARSMGSKAEIEVVPNGVDIGLFSRSFNEAALSEIRKHVNKKVGDVLLVTASRLVPKNGVDDILKALPLLPERFKFLILGTGPDEWKLKLHVIEEKIEGRVIFLGQVPHADIPKYFKIADVFVRPSISEGMGNAFIEAMAAGIPVIATPVGGIVDFLFDPEKDPDKATGLFCIVHNPQSIADQVKRLVDDHSLRERLIANAQKLVREKYDWSIVAQAMRERVFGNLFNNRTASSAVRGY